MINKTTYFILSIILSVSVLAQNPTKGGDDYVLDGDDYVMSFDSLKTKDKLHYGFEMGVGFGQSGTYGNYFSTYYSPQISYEVSPRFSINTGVTYVNSSVDKIPVMSEYNYQVFSGNISEYYAFVEGQYQLNDRLIIAGSVFYNFTEYNVSGGSTLSGGSGLENLGYSASFEYKVNESMSIYGEIRINDRNPYRQSGGVFSNGFMGAQTSLFGR